MKQPHDRPREDHRRPGPLRQVLAHLRTWRVRRTLLRLDPPAFCRRIVLDGWDESDAVARRQAGAAMVVVLPAEGLPELAARAAGLWLGPLHLIDAHRLPAAVSPAYRVEAIEAEAAPTILADGGLVGFLGEEAEEAERETSLDPTVPRITLTARPEPRGRVGLVLTERGSRRRVDSLEER